MVFKRKRTSFSYGARKSARSYRRRKVGYRKYVRKAATTRRPARFAFSRRSNRLNRVVAKTIRGMAETKIIPMRQSDWIQPGSTATGKGISTVKFVTGSTAVSQFGTYLPQGGFAAPQGDGKGNRDGQFIWLKGTTVHLSIQLDYVTTGARPGPITFRVICFKLKRALSPAGVTVSPDNNLFLRNDGSNQGDSTAAPADMDQMDMMLQPINTNSFYVISDRKFNLCHTQNLSAAGAGQAASAIQSNLKDHKTLTYRLKHETKARINVGQTDEPVDYDYRFMFAIYAFWPNAAAQAAADRPTAWSASIRGTTGFLDV